MGVVTRVDAEGRIRIPEQWGDDFGPDREVELERRPEGLLIRPRRRLTMAEALRQKYPMRDPACLDLSRLDMDDFGW